MTGHACPAAGCGRPIAHYLLVCSACWRLIPRPLRNRYDQARQRAARQGPDVVTPELAELQAAIIERASAERLNA